MRSLAGTVFFIACATSLGVAVGSSRADALPPFPLGPLSTAPAGWAMAKDGHGAVDTEMVIAAVPCVRDPSWDPESVRISVYQIRYESNSSARRIDAGKARLSFSADYPVWMQIDLDDVGGAAAGGKLWIDLAAVGRSRSGESRQTVKQFEFIREKAVPETPHAVTIDIVEPLFREAQVSMSPFSVRIAHAPENASNVVEFLPALGDGVAEVGSVSFKPVTAKGRRDTPIGLPDIQRVPLGASEHAIRAKALEQESAVKVTVVRRLGVSCLILLLGAGILSGSLIRILLPRKIANYAFLSRLGRLELAFIREGAARDDRQFKDAVDSLRAEVTMIRAAPKKDDTAREADLAAIEASLAAAVAAFEQRRVAESRRVGDLRTLLAAGWRLPGSIRSLLSSAAERLARASDAIAGRKLAKGTDEANAAIRELSDRMSALGQMWWKAVRKGFDAALAGLPAAQQTAFAEVSEALHKAVPAGDLDSSAPDAGAADQAARIRVSLLDLDGARRKAEAAWSLMREAVLDHLATAQDHASAYEICVRVENFDIGGALSEDAPFFAPLTQNLAAAFALQPEAKILGPGMSGTPARKLLVGEGPVLPATSPDHDSGARSYGWLNWEVRHAERAAWQLTALQSVIAGALIVLIGYSVFSTNWVGTLPEIVKVVFWGFTADMGLGTLITRVSSLGGP